MARIKYTPRRTYTPKTPAGMKRPTKRKTIKEKRVAGATALQPKTDVKKVIPVPPTYPGRGRAPPLSAIKIPEDVKARRKVPVVTPREERYIRTLPTKPRYIPTKPTAKQKKKVTDIFLKRKDISPTALDIKKKKVQAWQAKDFPKWVTDFLGDPAKLSGKDRKLVLPFYGKNSEDALKQKQAMTYFSNNVYKDVKNNPAKAAFFFMIGKYSHVGGKVLQAKYVKKLLKKIPQGELIAKRTLQAISYALGVTYTINIYNRVTEPVVTGYKDGKILSTESKTLPNGDIQITQEIEQIPITRKPTGLEQHTRMGGIFATELLPLHLGIKAVDRGIKSGYKPEPKPKQKVKVITKIKRAGKIIKTTPAKIKTLPGKVIKAPTKIKTKAQKAKETRAIKKRHEKLAKDIKVADKKFLKEKVKVLKVTKGELQLLRIKRSKLLKDQVKAKGKERTLIQKRIKQVERELAFKTEFKPKKKIVGLSDSAYKNIIRINKQNSKIKSMISKIKRIPGPIAKRRGIDKAEELRNLNALLFETQVMKTYVRLVKPGVPKKTLIVKLRELPENTLRVLDTKTNKIIKNVESTIKDIELRVIKPSKKPPVGFKEVRMEKGMIQLQKQVQKQAIKQVILTKSELKVLGALNVKTKAVVRTRPHAASAMKTRQRQLQKAKTQIKSKQKVLLLLKQRLQSNLVQLKKQKHVFVVLSKSELTSAQTTRTLHIITSITKQIDIIQSMLKPISKTIIESRAITAAIVVPVIVPVIAPSPIKRKVKAIKKKKKASMAYEDWFIKNSIPTFKSLYGF